MGKFTGSIPVIAITVQEMILVGETVTLVITGHHALLIEVVFENNGTV